MILPLIVIYNYYFGILVIPIYNEPFLLLSVYNYYANLQLCYYGQSEPDQIYIYH